MKKQEEDALERLPDLLRRCVNNLSLIAGGEYSARDDLAVALHQLVGSDDDAGLLFDSYRSLGLPLPHVPVWGEPMHRTFPSVDGLAQRDVIFGFRTNPFDEAVTAPLDQYMKEECLITALSNTVPIGRTREYLTLLNRHKYGAHSRQPAPDWLRAVRYYPAADGDVLSYLLWSIGRTVVGASLPPLAGALGGLPKASWPPDDYFNGVRVAQVFYGRSGQQFDCQAEVALAAASAHERRAIIGGYFEDQPFIFGVERAGELRLQMGHPGGQLRGLYRHEWRRGW